MTRLAGAFAEFTLRDSKFSKGMARVGDSMNRMGQRLQKLSNTARNVLLAGGAALVGFIKLAADQEQAELALRAALRATGMEVDKNAAKLMLEASAIQEVTRHGDESVLMLQALAINLGANADSATKMVKAAIGMGAALGQDVNPALLRMIALAEMGDFTMLRRYIPALRSTNDALEQLAIFQEFTNRGFAQEIELTKSTSGQFIQLKNTLGDLGELIGSIFNPALRRNVAVLRELLPEISEWITKNQAAIRVNTILAAKVLALVVILPKLIALLAGLIGLLASAATRWIALSLAMSAVIALPIVNAIRLINAETAKMKDNIDASTKAWKEFGDARKKQLSDPTAAGQLQALNDQLAINARQIQLAKEEQVRKKGQLATTAGSFFVSPERIEEEESLAADIKNLDLLIKKLENLQKIIDTQRAALRGPVEDEKIIERGSEKAKAALERFNKLKEAERTAQKAADKRRLEMLKKEEAFQKQKLRLMQQLELIGISAEDAQAISRRQQKEELIASFRALGILSKELEREIDARFARRDAPDEAADIEGPGGAIRARFAGISQSMRNLQADIFGQANPLLTAMKEVSSTISAKLDIPISAIQTAIQEQTAAQEDNEAGARFA